MSNLPRSGHQVSDPCVAHPSEGLLTNDCYYSCVQSLHVQVQARLLLRVLEAVARGEA